MRIDGMWTITTVSLFKTCQMIITCYLTVVHMSDYSHTSPHIYIISIIMKTCFPIRLLAFNFGQRAPPNFLFIAGFCLTHTKLSFEAFDILGRQSISAVSDLWFFLLYTNNIRRYWNPNSRPLVVLFPSIFLHKSNFEKLWI